MALGKTLTDVAREEHVARRVGDVRTAAKTYTERLGYTLVHEFRDVTFLQKGDDWVELIPTTMPEHEAYAVPDKESYTSLFESFSDAREDFEVLTESVFESDTLCRAMFRHKATGLLVQIIWRSKLIFEDVFPPAELGVEANAGLVHQGQPNEDE